MCENASDEYMQLDVLFQEDAYKDNNAAASEDIPVANEMAMMKPPVSSEVQSGSQSQSKKKTHKNRRRRYRPYGNVTVIMKSFSGVLHL